MNVQVFGFKNDFETRKALRFFSERRLPVHFVDLDERPASRGELRRFVERLGAAALVDRESARFRSLGLRVSGNSPERLVERAPRCRSSAPALAVRAPRRCRRAPSAHALQEVA